MQLIPPSPTKVQSGTCSMIQSFRQWFNRSDHADVLLHVRIEREDTASAGQPVAAGASAGGSRKRPREQEQSTGAAEAAPSAHAEAAPTDDEGSEQQEQDARTYFSHSMCLAAQSEWFNAALSKAWLRQASSGKPSSVEGTSGIRHELTVYLQPQEVEAMDLLLRIMYGHDIPDVTEDTGTTVPLLFNCLRLADRFASPCCMELLLEHLRDVSVNVSVLRQAYNVTPGIADKPTYKQLLDSCRRFILQSYSNVPAVIKNKLLRQEFLTLPFAAVLAWVESDRLRVQSENCVVYLLSAWVELAQDEGMQGVSNEQLEQLAHQVRVAHLGPAYLHHILPQLEWFNSCSDIEWMPTLLTLLRLHGSHTPAFSLYQLQMDKDDWQGPEKWVARPRKQLLVGGADRTLTWEVGGKQLRRLCDGQQCLSPTSLYIGGFNIHLHAYAEPTPDGEGVTLGLYYHVPHSQVGASIVLCPKTAVVLLGPITFMVVTGDQEPEISLRVKGYVRFGDAERGNVDVLGKSAPTMTELLAPHLKNGKLHLEAVFTHVDRR